MEKALPYCKILNTNINVTNLQQAVDYIDARLQELRGEYICLSNVHTTVMAYEDADYRQVQNSAALALPDGKPLSLVSRLRGHREAERVAGPDLMPALLRLSEKKGYTQYFYGSTPETLALLEQNLKREYPGLQIAGMYSPPFRSLSEQEDAADMERISQAAPDLIWVGLGAPKQEQWMYRHRGRVPGVMLGVGAAFDFHAGTVKRAPRWMQVLCLEWLYRIFQDPKRLLKRYLATNFKFIWYALLGK